MSQGYCKYESLLDGTLDLMDLQLMNDHIDMTAENEARYMKATQNK